MDVKAFLSRPFMKDRVPTLRARGFATRIGIDGQVIAFSRRDASGEFALKHTAEVVIDRAGNRRQSTGGFGTGAVETTIDGELAGWAPLPIEQGDRFRWGKQVCEITLVLPEQDGVVWAEFTLLQTEGG